MKDARIIILDEHAHPSDKSRVDFIHHLIMILVLFILWSFFAFISALVKPFSALNPLQFFIKQSNTLAGSLLVEIIGNYFSPFSLVNITIIILMVNIAKKFNHHFNKQLKRGLDYLEPRSIASKTTIHSIPIISIKAIDRLPEIQLSSNEIINSELILDIAPLLAVCVENKSSIREIIFNLNKHNQRYHAKNITRFDDVIPCNDKTIYLNFSSECTKITGLPPKIGINYGFPKVLYDNNQWGPNPEIIATVNDVSDYQTWFSLFLRGLLIALSKCGFVVSNYDHKDIYIDKVAIISSNTREDKTTNHFQNSSKRKKKSHLLYQNYHLFSYRHILHRNRSFSIKNTFLYKNFQSTDISEEQLYLVKSKIAEIEDSLKETLDFIFSQVYKNNVVKISVQNPLMK